MMRDEAIELAASALEAGANKLAAGATLLYVGKAVDVALGTSEMMSQDTVPRWREVAAALRKKPEAAEATDAPDKPEADIYRSVVHSVRQSLIGAGYGRTPAGDDRYLLIDAVPACVNNLIHRVELAELRAAAALRAPEADGWLLWTGGECPVPTGTAGWGRLRSGSVMYREDMSSFRWTSVARTSDDIVAYRVDTPARKPAFVPGFRPAPAPALPEAPDGVTWALCVIIDDTDATLTREPHPCDGATPGYRIQTPGDRSMPAVDLWLGADDVGRLVAALRLLGAPA